MQKARHKTTRGKERNRRPRLLCHQGPDVGLNLADVAEDYLGQRINHILVSDRMQNRENGPEIGVEKTDMAAFIASGRSGSIFYDRVLEC